MMAVVVVVVVMVMMIKVREQGAFTLLALPLIAAFLLVVDALFAFSLAGDHWSARACLSTRLLARLPACLPLFPPSVPRSQPDVFLDENNRKTIASHFVKVIDTYKESYYKQGIVIFPLATGESWTGHNGKCDCQNCDYCFYDTYNRVELKKETSAGGGGAADDDE
jgi:hypothetical protein